MTDFSPAEAATCPVCLTVSPRSLFCGNCGAEADARISRLQILLRPRTFVVAPRQRVTLPMVTSSVFPRLGEAARIPFRHGLFVLLALLVALSAFRLLGPLVIVICLGAPLLFGVYVWRSDTFKDPTAPALGLAAGLGAVIGVAWWLSMIEVIATVFDVPFAAAAQLQYAIGVALSLNAVGTVLMILPALAVRPLRICGREALDGFHIGALGALSYSAAGTTAWLAPQFVAGLLDNFSPWRLLEEALLYGFYDPLTAASLGGMVGLALWFRPARRGGNEPPRPRLVLWALAAASAGVYTAVYVTDAAQLPRGWEIGINAVLTALALIVLRAGIQIAMLHEAPDLAGDAPIRCDRCARTVPDCPFCPECGAAARGSSRAARPPRRAGAAAVDAAVHGGPRDEVTR